MLETTLQTHIDLCEQIYALILEENRLLKQSGNELAETILDKKRYLLSQLDESLGKIKDANSTARPRTPQERLLIDKAQQLILKTLLLDRENEQLLLRKTVTAPRPVKPSTSHLQRIYGKYNA